METEPVGGFNRQSGDSKMDKQKANGDGTTDLSSELGVRLGQVLTDLELLLNEFETITDNTLIKSGEGYKSIDEIRKHLK